MNLLYWNIHKNNIPDYVYNIITENDIDIFISSEYDKLDFEYLKSKLNSKYLILEGFGYCDKVKILYKDNITISLLKEQSRHVLCKILHNQQEYLLTAVHLSANPQVDADGRKCEIRKIVSDIIEEERLLYGQKMQKSIVIGDMNANPFDSEMVNKDAFNAVLFKKVIDERSSTVYSGDAYERFYNPMLNCIKEDNESYGTFYYSSGIGPLYWNCYDQILVRKALMNNIEEIKFLKKIKGEKLLNKTKPNDKISDHLPLFVKINL